MLFKLTVINALVTTALAGCKYATLHNATWGLDLYNSTDCSTSKHVHHQRATGNLKAKSPGDKVRCSKCTPLDSGMHGKIESYVYTSTAWYLELRWYKDTKCHSQLGQQLLGKQKETDTYIPGVHAFQICTP
ncbi:hypothetical protein BJ138DRAFT_272446 [Hygrophoropsis aurantiaca]|uniref:Uncharacterized protein n=1 Tax=Hygrophoropsis aurantiaca TaxID=72124 RepID=A0ACB8A7Q3_9AGAM|nr:hypothetical protein BJ138DRAFT_272446 [Hygrophoropsis aurantiaca]